MPLADCSHSGAVVRYRAWQRQRGKMRAIDIFNPLYDTASKHDRIDPRRRRDGAARPDPRRHRSLQRRPESAARSTSASASTTTTTARCRCSNACAAPSASMAEQGRAARLPADRRPAGVRPRGAERWCSAPTREPIKAGRVVTVQALGGTGGAQDRRRFPAPRSRRARRSGSATRAGRITARCSRTPGFAVNSLSLLRRGDARPRFRRHDRARSKRCRAGAIVVLHACCHNPTGVDLDGRRSGTQSSTIVKRARAGAVPRHRLPGLRRRHRRRRRAWCARSRDAPGRCSSPSSFSKSFSLYGERVGALSVVTAEQRRGGARAVAS